MDLHIQIINPLFLFTQFTLNITCTPGLEKKLCQAQSTNLGEHSGREGFRYSSPPPLLR